MITALMLFWDMHPKEIHVTVVGNEGVKFLYIIDKARQVVLLQIRLPKDTDVYIDQYQVYEGAKEQHIWRLAYE